MIDLLKRLALPLCLLAGLSGAARGSDTLTVFAAASLKTALDEIAETYRAETDTRLRLSYAGSSALARQIEYGAPADLFLSANSGWMDTLEQSGRLAPGTRRDLLTNSLVLVAPAESDLSFTVSRDMDLVAALGGGRIAMALVEAVPAGIYGRKALEALGMWDEIQPHVAQTDNVRAALRLVSLGETPLGIVYATDAMAEPRVRVVGTFDATLHPPIVYPLAVLRDGDSPAARALADFLASPLAGAIFRRHGFGLADPSS